MTSFLQFTPIYQERVWGGRTLGSFLGRSLPDANRIGESWEVVDRPEAQSLVAFGTWAGSSLRSLLENHGSEIMGPNWPRDLPFPILIKWLDCRERLSLQVHPPAAVSVQLGGQPKTENWYIARAEPGAAVLAGLKPGVDSIQFRAALFDNTTELLVQRLPTTDGDSLLIPSGVVHAIDGGNLILEIQQNSDTTYRVYDWGRVGLDGKPRAMHVEQSMACIEANVASVPNLVRSVENRSILADCAEFRISRHHLSPGENLTFQAREQARLISVVDGSLEIDGEILALGDNGLVPWNQSAVFMATKPAVVLVTDNFSSLDK